MAYVCKIKYGDSLRRLTIPASFSTSPSGGSFSSSPSGGPRITFSELNGKIREFFPIPEGSKLVLTYTDNEGDVITMADDQDIYDAFVVQKLNPLRISVTVETEAAQKPEVPGMKPVLENALNTFSLNVNSLKSVLEPLLKDGSEKALSEVFQFLDKAAGVVDPSKVAKKAEGETSEPSRPQAPANKPVESNNVFHHNVQCDGCGMSPIAGPRFKSVVKEDYDLCLTCFNDRKGSESEYTRYDHPIQRQHYFPAFGGRSRCPAMGHKPLPRPPYFRCNSRGFDVRSDHHGMGLPGWMSKPDGRFVCDSTIPDGTELEPGTQFVKIWRLRNSGKVPWVHGTQLVRVGGDDMGTVSAVMLQLPPEGVLPEQEVEVAVDLVAPERPGRYVSYWRLMNPYNVKFGHRVWALIQVCGAPKASTDLGTAEGVADDYKEVSENAAEDEFAVERGPTYVEATSTRTEGGSTTASSNSSSGPSSPKASDESKASEAVEVEGFSVVNMPEQGVEEMLAKLEAMGFKQRKLNQELLERNEYDVQRTLDDLVSASEWDPILEELEEMGFYDGEMNRRLLFKNKGSVKHVVKELVQLYKEAPQKPEA